MTKPRPQSRTSQVKNILRLSLTAASFAVLGACAGTGGQNDGDWYGGGDPGAIALPSRNESVSFFGPGSGNVQRNLFAPVYFGFDRSDISGTELAKVSAVAQFLKSEGKNNTVIVAGFTDSTGTQEYNRQLGERRALAVRSALVAQGINPSRVHTVSFGEDMPASPGNAAANRRAEFGIIR
ncbi:MAG: OmpA family protein [Verrucomicrobiota bacterium]